MRQEPATPLHVGRRTLTYELPYTDLHDQGLDGLFAPEAAEELVTVLEEVKRHAAA